MVGDTRTDVGLDRLIKELEQDVAMALVACDVARMEEDKATNARAQAYGVLEAKRGELEAQRKEWDRRGLPGRTPVSTVTREEKE